MDFKDNIIKYADELRALPYELGDGARIIYQDDWETYSLDLNAEASTENIKCISGEADYAKSALIASRFNVMIQCKLPFASRSIEAGEDLYPVLDDTAMIIGVKIPLVKYVTSDIGKALKLYGACNTENGYSLCCGANLYEAYTCLTILEKNAEIYQKAKVLGGANRVKPYNALLEHLVYRYKYSTKERSQKNADEGRN